MQRLVYDLKDLNLPLCDVFTNNPKEWSHLVNLKALLGAHLANLERVFRGVFGQELRLEGSAEQYELFKKVFPLIGTAMERSFGLEGFHGFCCKLSALKNAFVHAFSDLTGTTERIDPSFMANIPNWNEKNVRYVVDGDRLTLGGLLAILLCMGNKEMNSKMLVSGVNQLVRNIGLWRDFCFVSDREYVQALETNIGNDFEQEIRTLPGDDVFSSVWGEYAFRITGDANGFVYKSEANTERPTYSVYGSIEDEDQCRIVIKQGSYYHVYFNEEYVLEIADRKFFIECANKVPPFLFVAYLYRKGVKRFDRRSLSDDDGKLFPKLNRAKFYVDKNIHVILLGKAVSDQRSVHQAAVPQALFAILNLESNLLKAHKSQIGYIGKYSKIKEVLLAAGIDHELAEDTMLLRNFFAHGAIFGDYNGRSDNSFVKIELADCLDIFKRLVVSLKEKGEFAGDCLQRDVSRRFAEQLVDMKYKALAKTWFGALEGELIDWVQYAKTMNRISHSYVTPAVEEQLSWFESEDADRRYDIVEIQIGGKERLKPTGQNIPEMMLTVAFYKSTVHLVDIIGEGSARYHLEDHSENRLVSLRKYR